MFFCIFFIELLVDSFFDEKEVLFLIGCFFLFGFRMIVVVLFVMLLFLILLILFLYEIIFVI